MDGKRCTLKILIIRKFNYKKTRVTTVMSDNVNFKTRTINL